MGLTAMGFGREDKGAAATFLLDMAKRAWARVPADRNPVITPFYNVSNVETLLDLAMDSLSTQRTLIRLMPPITLVGDIHGFYRDLLTIFTTLGAPPTKRYLFLGDYVDRGEQSLESIILLLTYKTLYPDHVFLLRGNHEVGRINRTYGFYESCVKQWDTGERSHGERLWRQFNAVFDNLPISALVGNKILCMHGGLSPYLQSLEQLEAIPKPIRNPKDGLANDLLWSDPEVGIMGWQPSPRGTSFLFGADVVRRFCTTLGLDLIVRAHQCCQDGHRFFAQRKLLTIFSAPMYCPVVKNSAAVVSVDTDLSCAMTFFIPPARRIPTARPVT